MEPVAVYNHMRRPTQHYIALLAIKWMLRGGGGEYSLDIKTED